MYEMETKEGSRNLFYASSVRYKILFVFQRRVAEWNQLSSQ